MHRSPRLLITAGPTHEPIDAVRYIGNRSTGRMGLALAQAAIDRGLSATLMLGPTSLPTPTSSLLAVHRFQTAADLQRLLADHWPAHDVLIMAAAVADFRPRAPVGIGKLRRGSDNLTVDLEPTPDLLAGLGSMMREEQRVIGFALEPATELQASAREKLRRKGLHAIVANPLETMDSERITATLILADGSIRTPGADLAKNDFAAWLIDQSLKLGYEEGPGIAIPGPRDQSR